MRYSAGAGGQELQGDALVARCEGRGANHLERVVVDGVHVQAGPALILGQPAEDQDAAGLAGHLHCLDHRHRRGRGGDDHLRALAAGQSAYFCHQVGLGGVDRGVRPERLDHPQPLVHDVGYDDAVGAAGTRQAGVDAADGTRWMVPSRSASGGMAIYSAKPPGQACAISR